MTVQRLTVCSDPSSEYGYQVQASAEFGKTARVPEPFDFDLDTSSFKRTA